MELSNFIYSSNLCEAHYIFKEIDKTVLELLLQSDCMIAGGACVSAFSSKKINDIDIYFPKTENNIAVEKRELLRKFLYKEYTYIFKTRTDFADTYVSKQSDKKPSLQLIGLYEGLSAKDILSYFDFICCMCAIKFKSDLSKDKYPYEFLMHGDFLLHVAQKRLVYNTFSEFPFASIIRAFKYIKKGYTIRDIELLKLILKCNSITINDYKDLRRNLLGIDTLFLKDLTDSMLEDERCNLEYEFQEAIQIMEEYLEEKFTQNL